MLALATSALVAQSDADAALQEMGARAQQAVAKAIGHDFDGPIRFRYVERSDLRAAMKDELLPQMAAQFGEGDAAEDAAKMVANVHAYSLLAKYAFASGDVLVCESNRKAFAHALDMPELASDATLQAILVHECVHAAAQQRYDWVAKLNSLKNTDEISAFNAVLEGHAQFVARRVCTEHGWLESFERFTKTIGMTPDIENDDEGAKQLRRSAAISLSWAYYDGEEFIAKIHEADGEKAIAKAYATPPDSPGVIFNPEWFLKPSTRPAVDFEFDRAFDAFEKPFAGDEWMRVRRSMAAAELKGAMAALPKKDVDRAVSQIVDTKTSICKWKSPPGEKLVVGAVFVLDSHAAAASFLALEERLSREKDKLTATGSIKLLESTYTNCDDGEVRGLHVHKRVQFRGQEANISTVNMCRGRAVVELLYSNYEIDQKAAIAAARNLLDLAQKKGEPAAAVEKKDD